METKDLLQGIVVPIPSPCDEEERLDHTALARHYQWLLDAGVDGMYICGGTGDAEKLTPEERREIAGLLVPGLRKAGKAAVVHVGQTNQRTALALARHAGEVGAHAIAAIPPRGGWQAARVYYKALAAVGLPVLVYYIPGVTGLGASMADIASLLEIPGVAGIKVSDWNSFLIRQIKLAYPEKAVFTGFDEMLLPGLLYGADGSIGTWANLFPVLYGRVYRLCRAGEYAAAQALSGKFTEFLAGCWQRGVLPAFEVIMREKGLRCCFRQPPSWPGAQFTAEESRALLREAEALEAVAAAQGST